MTLDDSVKIKWQNMFGDEPLPECNVRSKEPIEGVEWFITKRTERKLLPSIGITIDYESSITTYLTRTNSGTLAVTLEPDSESPIIDVHLDGGRRDSPLDYFALRDTTDQLWEYCSTGVPCPRGLRKTNRALRNGIEEYALSVNRMIGSPVKIDNGVRDKFRPFVRALRTLPSGYQKHFVELYRLFEA